DDDIIAGEQETVGNLALGRKTFAGTGRAQNQAVGVLQQLAIHHDEVVGKSIDAVIQRLFAILKKFLRRERYKDSGRTGGQPALDLDLVQTQRQRGHQAFLLLEIQPYQLAVVLLGDTRRLEDVVVQLPGGVRRVQHQKRHQEHPLITALQ